MLSSMEFALSNLSLFFNMAASVQEEQAFLFAVQLSTAAAVPIVMKAAIELNVFEIIAKAGPGAQLSPKEIASQLRKHNPTTENMLDRILRLLASHSVLTSSVNTLAERVYGLAPVCKYFVQNEDGVSISPYLLMCHDKVFMDCWYHLTDAILEGGIPFNKTHGMHLFEYPKIDPRFNQVFNNGMLNYTTIFAEKMVETYKGFEGLKDVVDIGGGHGTAVSIITSKYPKVKGINFDLPHVIEHAPSYPGVEHVGGDMFESVPTGEAIFMKWILHDWSDERCSKLLRNCYEALPDSGKLIVVDGILPVAVESDTAAKGLYQIDVGMMTMIPGGKERTEEEFRRLGKGAGFKRIEKVCCVYYYWVMEFYKM